jgi:hypothetical protein
MERLASANGLVIRQKKEWREAFTGIEHRNQYAVLDPAGGDLYLAVEEGGSTLARLFLRNMRPFTMRLRRPDGTAVLRFEQPFRWWFRELRVFDETHQRTLGTIRRQWSWLRRIYSVRDAGGLEVYRLLGPLRHPWTFEIRQGERVAGRIVKKWSGLTREALTEADNFGITFPAGCAPGTKAVLLGAVFLIDFVHFEGD